MFDLQFRKQLREELLAAGFTNFNEWTQPEKGCSEEQCEAVLAYLKQRLQSTHESNIARLQYDLPSYSALHSCIQEGLNLVRNGVRPDHDPDFRFRETKWLTDFTISNKELVLKMREVEKQCLQGRIDSYTIEQYFAHWELLASLEKDERSQVRAALMAGSLTECLNTHTKYRKALKVARFYLYIAQDSSRVKKLYRDPLEQAIFKANAYRYFGVSKKHFSRNGKNARAMASSGEFVAGLRCLLHNRELGLKMKKQPAYRSAYCDILQEYVRLCCSSIERVALSVTNTSAVGYNAYMAGLQSVGDAIRHITAQIWTDKTVDPLLRLIGDFERAILLCEQDQRLIYHDTMGRAELLIRGRKPMEGVTASSARETALKKATVCLNIIKRMNADDLTEMEQGWRDQLEIRILIHTAPEQARRLITRRIQESEEKNLTHAMTNFSFLEELLPEALRR